MTKKFLKRNSKKQLWNQRWQPRNDCREVILIHSPLLFSMLFFSPTWLCLACTSILLAISFSQGFTAALVHTVCQSWSVNMLFAFVCSLPKCLKSRFAKLGTYPPILLQSGVNTTTKGNHNIVWRWCSFCVHSSLIDTGSNDGAVGSHD